MNQKDEPLAAPAAAKLSVEIGLVVLVLAVFWGSGSHTWLDFDDGEYVFANPHVMSGLTAAGLRWAFTSFYAANWHPLTWLSHMADVQYWGLNPGAHHRVNVLLHALNALLLFRLFRKMTKAVGPSALVAALFAVHPLHVESVAWIAERKDVLATFFLLASALAYVGWVERRKRALYASSLALFALGLLSKSMIVTLPFVLLLLDVWPLRRESRPLIVEKIPFFILAALASTATWLAQSRAGAAAAAESFPWGQRIANAIVSYGVYLRETLWPAGLAVFYPHPATLGERVSAAAWISSAALLAVLTALVLRQIRKRPYLAFGWLWFLGMLVPVIGLVQVGSQAHADRYTYIPLIGIFAAISWGGAELAARIRAPWQVQAAVAAAFVLALSAVARRQNSYWVDGVHLYTHAIDVTKDNWLAWNNLGMQYLTTSRIDRAESDFRRSIAIKPDYAIAWYNLGVALGSQQRHAEAIASYAKSVELDPNNADGWVNLSLEYQSTGDLGAAIRSGDSALKVRPEDTTALSSVIVAHWMLGHAARSREYFDRLSRISPATARGLALRMNQSPP